MTKSITARRYNSTMRQLILFTAIFYCVVCMGPVAMPTGRLLRMHFEGIDQMDDVYITPDKVDSYGYKGLQPSQSGSPSHIPKIIHRMWKEDNIESMPERWKFAYHRCVNVHPRWKVKLWTDQTMRNFIETNYSWFLKTYDSYKYDVQRFDAARYFILYHYGGVYLDLDVSCRRPMDPIRRTIMSKGKGILIAETEPIGFSNDILFATAGHPFLGNLVHSLKDYKKWLGLPYLTVMYSTGPIYLSTLYHQLSDSSKRDIAILSTDLYANPDPNSKYRFFRHLDGSSWHSMDAIVVHFVARHKLFIASLFLIFLKIKQTWKNQQAKQEHKK